MIFIKFTELQNHHYNAILEHFHLPIKFPPTYFHLGPDAIPSHRKPLICFLTL